MRGLRLITVLVAAALLVGMLAACGDGDDEDPTATPAEAGASPTSAAPTDEPTEGPTATEAQPTATETAEPSPSPTTVIDPTPTEASAEPTATEGEELTLNVYFIRDEKLTVAHRTIPHTLAVGAAAMEALLAGPSDEEAALGFISAIPDDTELRGLTIDDGIATVDLSAAYESGGGSFSVMARLAQVVFTLTQFPTVDAVQFMLEGEPVEVFSGEGVIIDGPLGRDFEELQPAIFVESVAVGDVVSSPLTITGTANTFEATFQARIVTGAGELLTEQVVTATSGTGTRGTFEATLTFEVAEETPGRLVVFEYSARDGSPINVVEIPILLQP